MRELFEDFVLLEMLSAEPAKPTSNALASYRQTRDNTTISLEHECKIVNCLAFLFAITEDPLKVSALCLEMDHHGKACTIRVAMNTGIPKEFMAAFRSLARALEETCNTGKYMATLTIVQNVSITLHGSRAIKCSRVATDSHQGG